MSKVKAVISQSEDYTKLQLLKWSIGTTFINLWFPIMFVIMLSTKILTYPFPVWIFHKVEAVFFSVHIRIISFFLFTFPGTKIYMSGDLRKKISKSKPDRVIMINNHVSNIDPYISRLFALYHGYCGHVRDLVVEDYLFKERFHGPIYYLHGTAFVNTAGYFREGILRDDMRRLNNGNISTWLFISPEGRIIFDKNAAQVRNKTETAEPITSQSGLRNHLQPRTKALQIVLEELRENFDFVCDLTYSFGNTVDENGVRVMAPWFPEMLSGKCPWINIHIKWFEMKDIPVQTKELRIWLNKLFLEKDKVVEDFYSPDSVIRERALKRSTELQLKCSSTLPSVFVASILFLIIFTDIYYFCFYAIGSLLLSQVLPFIFERYCKLRESMK